MDNDVKSFEQYGSVPSEETRTRMLQAHELGKRVNMLTELTLKIGAAQSPEEVIQVLGQEARRVMPGECAFVGLLTEDQKSYEIRSICAPEESPMITGKRFSVNEGIAGWVLQRSMALTVDMNSMPVALTAVEQALRAKGVRALLVAPIRTHDRLLGVLGFGAREVNRYSDNDLWIAQLLGAQVALALGNTSVLKKAQKRINQIELVNRVSRNLSFTLDLKEMLDSAAQAIRKQFQYFEVMIFLMDHETQELELAAEAGEYHDFLPKGYRQHVSQGIIGWVASNGRYLLANDVRKEPRYLAYSYQDTSSELAAPITIDGVVVGVLNIEDNKTNAFDEADVLVAQILCDQIGGAIKNARLFEEIKRANERLVEHDQLKTEFVSIVSHDFRTPLSTIMLAAKSLLREEDPSASKRYREYLNIIVDQAGKLSKLAEDTLSIAKIESGQLTYQFKIVNVEAVIKDAIATAKLSSRHSIEYAVDLNASFVRGDQAKLRQVLTNLISNAVKYSPGGGKIVARAELNPEAPDEVIFSVADQGIGIPADQVGKLFQKFSRVDTGKAKEIRGTGLGLWICAEIIKAHGGRIWVESELGKGSTFKFTVKRGEENHS
jgi:K+-sensing histidine kinase KdpD